MRAPARLGRIGVLEYPAHDPAMVALRPGMPVELQSLDRPYRLARLADDVFAPESLASIAGKPLTNEHPAESVTADNYRKYVVGAVGSDAAPDGDYVGATVTFYDAATIADVDGGKAELSLGYDTRIEWTPGNPSYDGVQRDIRVNHLAVTKRGRSGPDVRVLDDAAGGSKTTMKRSIGGAQVEIDETVVAVVDSFLTDASAAAAQLAEANGKIAALETQLAEHKAEVARVTDAAYLDARVAERAALVADASRVAPTLVCDGLTDNEIRSRAVAERGIVLDGADAVRGAFVALAAQSTAATRIADAASKPVENEYTKARAALINGELHKGA